MSVSYASVSVVIPAYNAALYIRAAVDSVLDQELSACEIIVVDDGSTDATAEVISSYGERVRYVWQPNAERAVARNHGMQLASGAYVAFLDADDVWLPSKLAKQVDLLDCYSELAFVYSWVDISDSQLRKIRTIRCGRSIDLCTGDDIFADLLIRNFVTGGASSVVARASALRAVGGFDPMLRHVEDWDLWLRLAALGPVGFVPESLALYRTYGTRSAEKQAALGVRSGYPRVVEKALDLPSGRALPTLLRDRARARARLYTSMLSYSIGDFTRGGEDLIAAANLEPEFFDGAAPGFVGSLVAWAGNLRDDYTPIDESLEFTNCFFATLPRTLAQLSVHRRRVMSMLYATLVYRAWSDGKRSEVRKHFFGMILHDPRWLLNRGVWSLGVRMLLGR